METSRSNLTGVDPAEHEGLTGLLLRIGQGDREAFANFYRLTSRRVYGLARRIIVNVEIAQDTTQDIYLTVWRDAHKYNPVLGSAIAWLLMITHHKAVDKVRSEQAIINREARWVTASHSPDYDVVAETVTTRIEAQTVVQCLDTLSPRQREAIDLAYYDGLTYREVADHLSIPLPTIKSRIRDGLRSLRTCLDGDETK
ncbi:ECF RNA polymerase sigma factor SigK [Arthrobacter sp. TMN-50]